MQPLNDDGTPMGAREATPYAPPEPTPPLLNIGAILNVVAVVLAVVGSVIPFIALPGDIFQNGAPSSVLQFLSRALYSSFLNALPTVWFFAMVIVALVTIASIAGVHRRRLYVGQVILSIFAIFWGFMTVLTFTEPHRFGVDVRIAMDWGFFFYLFAFILSTIAGIISIRWSERIQQRDLVKSLKIS
jgi:hypothetical protein